MHLSSLSSTQVDWGELEQEIEACAELQQIKSCLTQDRVEYAGFHLQGATLMCKNRVVIPRNFKFIPLLLQHYHDSPLGGHAGEIKTYLRLSKEWFWRGMRQDVTKYMQCCVIC